MLYQWLKTALDGRQIVDQLRAAGHPADRTDALIDLTRVEKFIPSIFPTSIRVRTTTASQAGVDSPAIRPALPTLCVPPSTRAKRDQAGPAAAASSRANACASVAKSRLNHCKPRLKTALAPSLVRTGSISTIVSKWLWVASGRVQFAPMEKATLRLAENGIEFVGRKITDKHLR